MTQRRHPSGRVVPGSPEPRVSASGHAGPGHLAFRAVRRLAAFDIADCPWRKPGKKPLRGPDHVVTMAGGPARLWRLEGRALAPVLLHAKLVHGQVWLAAGGARPVPLALAAPCDACHRLHECAACFLPLERATGRSGRQDSDQPTGVVVPVREVWLLDDGAAMPQRPPPAEPVEVLRGLRRRGLVPLGYSLPSEGRRSGFRAEVIAAGAADNPLGARRHEGMSLQVTESCMCRCLMCNLVGYFKRPHMPLREVLRVMEEAALLGVRMLDVFGGEVTLRRDIFDLVRHARWLGMECMFITTGYYVTPAYARKLRAAGVNRIVVSLDGSRPEIHDSIRQLPGMFERAVRALRALAATKGLEAFASTVILEQNLHDLVDLVRLSGRLGIRFHEFFLPISGPVASTLPRWPSPGQARELLETIAPALEREAARWGVQVDFRPEFRSWPAPRRRAIELISSGCYNTHHASRAGRCLAAGWNLFVTVTGDVYPCDMPSLIRKGGGLGNLHDATLLDIVTGPAMARFERDAGRHDGCRMCVGRYEAVCEPAAPTATRG
ncbi:MAG: radical SAM protein [Deltaproteobacteria bacterium]|nr:radical SAM protein [Deltaproteobacteria bacterium]